MKTILQIFLFLFLFGPSSSAQVYEMSSASGLLFAGPENITSTSPGVKTHYVAEIQTQIDALKESIVELDAMSERTDLKKREKSRLNKLEKGRAKIEQDLVGLENLKRLWSSVESPNYEEMGIAQACFTYENKEGEILTERDIDLTAEENVDSFIVQEFIEIEKVTQEGRWIKKKVEGSCLSKDPDDCLVRCYVTDESLFACSDGREFDKYGNLENTGFVYQGKAKRLIRTVNIELPEPITMYTAFDSHMNEFLPLDKLTFGDCK